MEREYSLPAARNIESRLPGNPFQSLQQQVERLFDGFGPFIGRTGNGATVIPRVDVEESDEAFEVTAELPGVGKSDIDVRVSDNVVTLKGEKQSKHEMKDADIHLIERSYGSFQRSFTLPCAVDSAKVAAEFKDGVLHLNLPKAQKAREKQKKIAIR